MSKFKSRNKSCDTSACAYNINRTFLRNTLKVIQLSVLHYIFTFFIFKFIIIVIIIIIIIIIISFIVIVVKIFIKIILITFIRELIAFRFNIIMFFTINVIFNKLFNNFIIEIKYNAFLRFNNDKMF